MRNPNTHQSSSQNYFIRLKGDSIAEFIAPVKPASNYIIESLTNAGVYYTYPRPLVYKTGERSLALCVYRQKLPFACGRNIL